MIAYLIKVTIIWLVMMVLYEALFHKTAKHTANRIYLLGSLLMGLILPLMPINLPAVESPLETATGLPFIRESSTGLGLANNAINKGAATNFDMVDLGIYGYLLGVIVLLTITIVEVIKIMRPVITADYESINGQKIYTSATRHAPFSFWGYIFIAQPTQYSATELRYIVLHEQAHNNRKHGLDLLLMQFILIAFWFHPLVWRYRYLLKLAHEYEADAIAGKENAYDYGHFLLQQILLKGAPSITHSFHFSPIKNRINMLTQNRTQKGWKYLAIVPALLCCTLLMAKSKENNLRVKVGNKTTYKGNDFYWTEPKYDTVEVVDVETNEVVKVVQSTNPEISKVDKQVVHSASSWSNEPIFRYKNLSFKEYLHQQLSNSVKNIPDSIGQIIMNNLVIDENGKIVYFDMAYINNNPSTGFSGISYSNQLLDSVFENIVADCPNWIPGTKDGKPVKSFVADGGAIPLKSLKFKARPVGKFK